MAESSRHVLDVAALHSAIQAVARHRQMTMQAVANETGVGASTFTRMAKGKPPDADGLLTLLMWLNAPASDFASERGGSDG